MDNIGKGSEGSLPDQLPIQSKSSSSHGDDLDGQKFTPGKRKALLNKRKSKQLQAILKPRISAKKKYFTTASGINETNAKDLSKEPSPYAYPGDMEEFAYKVMTKAWRNDIRVRELNIKCFQKPSYKDRQKRDLMNRLYVKEAPVTTIKTVLDIDPQYFKIIEGRPIPDRLDIREYIQTVRDSLRTKIVNGYREDDIMLIEENLLLEQKMIDTILENYQTYVNTFEEFLYRDHTSAMQLLQDSEQASNVAYDKYEEYKLLSKKYGALRSSLYNSEEKWRNCKMYQKFLYVVSPLTWRAGQQRYRRASVYMMEDDPEDEENIFGKYRLSLAEKGASLTDILDQFRQECMNDTRPQLYFTSPEQLIDVFRFMEMQNLNSLLHSEELAIPLDHVKEGMRIAEQLFNEQINNLQEAIDKLAGGILWEEERAKYLEELAMKLISKEFRELVMEDDVLNLHVFVEDVYETRVGPNDANLSMLEMMKGIEDKYRNELLCLDKVPREQVAMLEGSCYMEQTRVMRLAEKAAKQYADLERLTYRLNKAFAPHEEKKHSKELKRRSPPVEPPKAYVPPPRELTEKEEVYLEYFTDFCKYSDDPKNYGIDITAEPTVLGGMRQDFFQKNRGKTKFVSRIKGPSLVERVIPTTK